MNRKYVVICSFFAAILVLSLLCYGSFCYAEKKEREKQIPPRSAETGGNREQKVTSQTRFFVAKYEEASEELVKEERNVPPEYAGLTRAELEHALQEEMASMSWEEEKAGRVKISLETFSEDQVVIKKVYNKSGEQGYILKLKDGEVVIYRKDEKVPFEKTGLLEESLSEEDRNVLRGGYAVRTEKELYSVLENFSS